MFYFHHLNFTQVYKTNLISTIVDSIKTAFDKWVYKTNLISTIVDVVANVNCATSL